MDAIEDIGPPRRWPVAIALAATLVWVVLLGLLATLAVAARSGEFAVSPGLQMLWLGGAVLLLLAAPLALIWLAATQLRERTGDRALQAAMLAQHTRAVEARISDGGATLLAMEERVAALVQRIESVAAPIEGHYQALYTAAERLDNSGNLLAGATDRAEAACAQLEASAPAAVQQAERLTELLGHVDTDLKRQVAEAEAMLAALQQRAHDAGIEAQQMQAHSVEGLAAIADTARAAHEAVAAPLAQLREGVDTAFARTASAMDATRDGVHTQTSALLASIDQARVTLDHIGGEAARLIAQRLESLLGTTEQLGSQLEAQATRSRGLIDEVERGFGVLDAKLGNSANAGTAILTAMSEKMAEARDAIFRLGEPIANTQAALEAVEAKVGDIGTAGDAVMQTLGSALPNALPKIEDMTLRLADLHDRVDALAAPMAASGDAIAVARGHFDTASTSLETATARFAAELAEARGVLDSLEARTGDTALSASTQLIEVFGRVREIANQTAGTMRETLSRVVEEAEQALDSAGSSRAETAFGAPIRAQLADIESAHRSAESSAQTAVERISQRLIGLAETVAVVERRIDEVDSRYEIHLRDDIARRSGTLLESLQGVSIDIAKLLSVDIDDKAWEGYLKGDKSVFTRRMVRLFDKETERAISRHFSHDPPFREQASRYMVEFESLIKSVLPDREGKTLAITLLSSDVGKLYVALAQATERLRG